MGLCAAGSIVALLMLEPGEEAVELAALEVELGELARDVEPVIELLGSIESSPVHLDGLIGLELARQGFCQLEDDSAFAGVGPHGPAEGVEPLFGPAQLEAEAGEKLKRLRVSRRCRQEVAAGLERFVDPA